MWRRLLAVTGLAAIAAWLVRRYRVAETPGDLAAQPSDELRRRLDEARRREDQAGAATGQPPAKAPSDAPADLELRRRGVHDRARAAAEEMRAEPE